MVVARYKEKHGKTPAADNALSAATAVGAVTAAAAAAAIAATADDVDVAGPPRLVGLGCV
jgi:hypothetical protein